MKTVACIGSVTTDIIVKPADSIPEAGTLRAVDNVECMLVAVLPMRP